MRVPPATPVSSRSVEAERVRAVVLGRLLGEVGEPTQVDRFVLLERLGAGATAVVYAAHDPRLNRKVALKLYRGARAEEHHARMVREAQALAQVNHPNVVSVYDVGEHQRDLYITMEYVAGTTLATWQAEGSRSWREVVEAYLQAGRGLAAIHDAGLIHRDFKPSNVIRGDDGRVRVLDLGLVRAEIGETVELPAPSSSPASNLLDSPLTRTGTLLGTPAYMAPEQLAGHTVGPASDQFALCVSLWEALHGQRPFVGDTVAELVDAMEQDSPRPGPRARARVPERLSAVLRRGLAKRPHDRWPHMSALLTALERATRRRWPLAVGASAGVAALLALGAWGRGIAVDAPRNAPREAMDAAPTPAPEPVFDAQVAVPPYIEGNVDSGYVAALPQGGTLRTILAGDGWQSNIQHVVVGQFGGTEHDDLMFLAGTDRDIWCSDGVGGWWQRDHQHDTRPWVAVVAGSFGSGLDAGQDLLLLEAEGRGEVWNYSPEQGWRHGFDLELPPGVDELVVGHFGDDAVDDLLARERESGAAYAVDIRADHGVTVAALRGWDEVTSVAAIDGRAGPGTDLARVREDPRGRGGSTQVVLELLEQGPGPSFTRVATLPLPGPAMVRSGALDSRGRDLDLLVYDLDDYRASVITVEPGPSLVTRLQEPLAKWVYVVPFDFIGDDKDELLFYGNSPPPRPPQVELGQVVEGVLAVEDLEDPTRAGHVVDDYHLRPSAEVVELRMRSTAFTPYLQLVDPGNSNVMTHSDDALKPGAEARIRARLSIDYHYTIRVSSLDARAVGPYVLELTEVGERD